MIRLAVIGIGNSGTELLAALRSPGQRFMFGNPRIPQEKDAHGARPLPPKYLPRLAANFNCVFLAGNPQEPDFGQLTARLSEYLSQRVGFLGAFLMPDSDQPGLSQNLRAIARHANCCFRYDKSDANEALTGAASCLQQAIAVFLSANTGVYARIDLQDAAALFHRDLDAFVCSASASGPDQALQAARELSSLVASRKRGKLSASLIHFSCQRDKGSEEIYRCCRYLECNIRLGQWLFSASPAPDSAFRIDIICASRFDRPERQP